MSVTFSYEKSSSSILGTVYRPLAQVLFYSEPTQSWIKVDMLVDTGADYSLLPKYLAEELGINLKKDCQALKTRGVGGNQKVYFLEKIKVKIGEMERMIPVGFLDSNDIPPLLGRHQFLETFEVTMSPKHTITFSDQ